jgi:hypothetical protein
MGKTLLDLIGGDILDPKSLTCNEIAEAKCIPLGEARRLMRMKVADGSVERVKKMVNGRRQPSYRLKS